MQIFGRSANKKAWINEIDVGHRYGTNMFSFSCSKLGHRDKYLNVYFFFFFMYSRAFWPPQGKPNGLPMERQNSSCSSTATGREVFNAAKRCHLMPVPHEATSRCSWWNSSADTSQSSVDQLMLLFKGCCFSQPVSDSEQHQPLLSQSASEGQEANAHQNQICHVQRL